MKTNFQTHTYGFTCRHFVSPLMSAVELGNDTHRVKTSELLKTSWFGVCTFSHSALKRNYSRWAFFSNKEIEIDQGTSGGRVADSVRQVKEREESEGRVIILCWRRHVEEGERFA